MDPPAYSAAAASRSIHDLRTQIIANGTVLHPQSSSVLRDQTHIELIVAKIHMDVPIHTPYSERQRYADLAADVGKHYAVLLVRNHSKRDVNIIFKSSPYATVEEALGEYERGMCRRSS